MSGCKLIIYTLTIQLWKMYCCVDDPQKEDNFCVCQENGSWVFVRKGDIYYKHGSQIKKRIISINESDDSDSHCLH